MTRPSFQMPSSVPNLSSAAESTTEEMRKAFKSLFQESFNCSDLSEQFPALASGLPSGLPSGLRDLRLPKDCTPLSGKDGGDSGAVELDWRADPKTSLSDLTLVVYDGGGGSVTYHVHTLLLVYGGRRSGYVAEQLAGKQGDAHVLEVYISPLATRALPDLLDFVYGSALTLRTSNAAMLRYLSNRLDVRSLHREVSTFLSHDLEAATAPQYAAFAEHLKDYDLRDMAVRKIADKFDKLPLALLRDVSPRLMRCVLQSSHFTCGSLLLSDKLAHWLRAREAAAAGTNPPSDDNIGNDASISSITDEDFYWLTHVQTMPQISPSEALFYLHYGLNFPQMMNDNSISSFKSRCFQACCDTGWFLNELSPLLQLNADGDVPNHSMDTGINQPISHAIDSGKIGLTNPGMTHSITNHDAVTSTPLTTSARTHSQHSQHSSHSQRSHSSSQLRRTQDDTPLFLTYYQNLSMPFKIQLLERSLRSARRQMQTKRDESTLAHSSQRDVQLSDELMYKSLHQIQTNHGKHRNHDNHIKLVILGCGLLPANGVYLKRHHGGRNRTSSANGNAFQRKEHSSSSQSTEEVYEKEAVWNGSHVTFVVYPIHSQYYSQYKLAVRFDSSNQAGNPNGSHNGNHDVNQITVLYNSPTVAGQSNTGYHGFSKQNGTGGNGSNRGFGGGEGSLVKIPENGWQVEGEGVHPPPQFVGRVGQLSTRPLTGAC